MFINPTAVQTNGIRFADGQIQGMNMTTAMIEQGADITIAVDLTADGIGIQQLQLVVTVALPVGFLLFQSFQLFVVHRHKQAAGAIVALNLIALDTFADDLATFKHHAAEHSCRVRSVGFFNDVNIAAIGVNQLAAVASAGAKANSGAFQQHHVVAHFGKM